MYELEQSFLAKLHKEWNKQQEAIVQAMNA